MTTQNVKKSFVSVLAMFALVIGVSFTSHAQFNGRWSIGGDLALPIGDFSNGTNFGIGVFGKFEAPVEAVPKLNWTATVDLNFFGRGDDYDNGNASYSSAVSVVPVLGGARYYILDDRFKGFYVSAEVGPTFVGVHQRYSYTNGNGNRVTTTSNDGTSRFTFAPGCGYHLPNWDFSARIVTMSDFNYLNLRVAYVFNKR